MDHFWSLYWICFFFFFFGQEAWKIVAPWPGIEPAAPSLEGRAPTQGQLGKFQGPCFICEAQTVLDGPGLPSKLFQKSFIINKKTCHDFLKFIYVRLLSGLLLLLWVFLSRLRQPCDICCGLPYLSFRFTKPALQRSSPFLPPSFTFSF